MMIVDIVQELNFSMADLGISRLKIERAIGYGAQCGIPEGVAHILDRVLEELHSSEFADIRGGFKIFPQQEVSFHDQGFCCRNIHFETHHAIASCLYQSSQLAVFIGTAGGSLEKLTKQYVNEGDIVSSYIVDTCGSVMAEAVAGKLHATVGEIAKAQWLNVTNRYSPGYCHWSVSEQHKLFSLMPRDFCGVCLTESSLMMPTKSVSGVIGIGQQVSKKAYACDSCDMPDCLLREKREEKKRVSSKTC